MKRTIFGFAALLTLIVPALAAGPDAQEILAAADRVHNPGQPYRLNDTLTEYVRGEARDRVTLVIYSKEDKKTGEFSNLVRYIDPPRDRGRTVLMSGPNMWFYDSDSKASVRISPQQRMMGQASNGDVMSVNYARDYRAKLAGEETIKDADRQDRACWHLDIAAANDTAVYSRIELWVEKGTYRQVKAKFYSDSGRLLKIAYYHKYTEMLGAVRAGETIIIDAVDQNLVTTMAISNLRAADIPDAWFQREYLPRLKDE
jgi:hypothetical protein